VRFRPGRGAGSGIAPPTDRHPESDEAPGVPVASWGRPPPWRHVFFRRLVRREIDQELDFHLEMRTNENRVRGLEASLARRASLRRFGDIGRVRDECHAIGEARVRRYRRRDMLDSVWQDVKFAARNLVRRPGFTAIILTTLALGIGATTAIFSVVDGVLLRPLPFEDPDRLVFIYGIEGGMRTGSSWMSYADWTDFVDQAQSVEDIEAASATNPGAMTIAVEGAPPTQIEVARVSHGLFATLGVRPVLGRGFLPEEDQPGGARVVVLGHGFWRDRTGADPEIVGQTLRLDGEAYTVVGVMPEGFDWLEAQLWLPLDPGHADDGRGMHRLLPVARLQDGVSLDQADAEMKAIAARLAAEYPETNTDRSARLEPIAETIVGNARTPVLMLFGATLVVLLIAGVNVANLLLARAAPREREVAIRATLGAGRGRLARQLLTESLVLSLIGGLIGVGLAFLGVKALLAAAPAGLARLDGVAVDLPVLVFAVALALVTGLACGLLPAIGATGTDLHSALKEGTGRQTGGRRHGRWADALVVFEVGVAVVLIGAAGLLLRSFVELRSVDAGFHEREVVAVPLSLKGDIFNPERVTPFYDELLARVRDLPQVEAAALGYQPPLEGGWETSFEIPGVHERPEGQRPEARIRPVTPGYFRTVGIPLLQGREFDERDAADGPGVVIINESLARTFFEGRDPLEHSIRKSNWWGADRPREYRIVGVVGDVKMDGMAEPTPWAMYFLHDQWPFSDMYLFARTAGDPHAVVPAIRDAVWALEPEMPVENIQTFTEMRSSAVAEERFQTLLVAGFAGLALLLACVGVFGVLSHAVSQRGGEIGIRMAVGARAADVVRLVVGKGIRLVAIGLVLGLAGTIAVTRFIRSLLFEVSPTEPSTLGAAALLLAVVALSACAIPAVRASRQDPVRALRTE